MRCGLAKPAVSVHGRDVTKASNTGVQVAMLRDGTTGYLVGLAPDALPPVRARDLSAAWDAARGAAEAEHWDVPRLFRFHGTGGSGLELALADPDACCWAGAVDRTLGLGSAYGISVCLRLLALVDLLASAPWARPWVALKRDGAEVAPSLLRIAAMAPLTPQGRLDEAAMQARLRRGPMLGAAAKAATVLPFGASA